MISREEGDGPWLKGKSQNSCQILPNVLPPEGVSGAGVRGQAGSKGEEMEFVSWPSTTKNG